MPDSERTRRLKADAGRKGGSASTDAKRAASAVKMTAIMRRRLATDREQVIAISSANGTTACAIAWRCDDCQRVIYGPAIGTHQRATGHTGRTRIDNINEETA
jgi:hypothetical protein